MDLLCKSCGARLVLAPELRTAKCPYCAAPTVVERPPTPDRPLPTFVLGFAQTHEAARRLVDGWLKSRHPWAHSGLRRAPLEDVRGLYVPAYLYSAMTRSEYRASIGENYTETETYTATENGKQVTRTRQVTKTEWRPLHGEHAEYVPDVLVTASTGLPNVELEHVEPFDLRMLARYDASLVSGWIAEEPSLSPAQCLELARGEAHEWVRKRLAAFMPGDSHRDLQASTALSEETLEPCLLPVWVLAARYDPEKPPLRVLVNGQTGEVYGKVPVSWVKVLVTVVLGLAVLAGLFLAQRGGR
jgi:DNA-directed RNA polymerase subunit RPC12/RpoP